MQHALIEQDRLKFRVGKIVDVEPLLRKFGLDHFTEGGFAEFAEFDLDRAIREMRNQVARDDTPLIVATFDGEDIGWISWNMMHVFTRRPIGVLWTIYVAPEHRGGDVGKRLVWSAVDLAKLDDACAFFATVAPNSTGGQALCRLFRKFGFADMGGAFFKGL